LERVLGQENPVILQKELKMLSRVAVKTLLLASKMVKKHLRFSRKYKHWMEKDWRNVMYFDESTFRVVNSGGLKVRRPSNISCYKQHYMIPTMKHSQHHGVGVL
jgi:hypothetical protein